MHKIKLWLIGLIALSSCYSSNKDLYHVRKLSKLKTIDESYIFDGYYHSSKFYAVNESFNIDIKYDSNLKDMIFTPFDTLESDTFKEDKINATNFLSNYFFITSEKLNKLFPVDMVKTEKSSIIKKTIIIKKINSEQNNQDNDFEHFEYMYKEGFLFLYHYHYSVNGKLSYNHCRFDY